MGLRTQRYGPVATTRRGASHGPGVPRPTTAKFQTHHRYSAVPNAITAAAGQTVATAVGSKRVSTHQGIRTAPAPGTTTVNSALRTNRLTMPASQPTCRWAERPGHQRQPGEHDGGDGVGDGLVRGDHDR